MKKPEAIPHQNIANVSISESPTVQGCGRLLFDVVVYGCVRTFETFAVRCVGVAVFRVVAQ